MKELKVKVVEIPINQIEENVGQIPDVHANPRRITDEAFELLKKSIDESPEMKQLDEVKVYPYNGKANRHLRKQASQGKRGYLSVLS